MKGLFLKVYATLMAVLLTACGKMSDERILLEQIQEVQSTYAPDKRTALFDISVVDAQDIFVLRGESNLPDAVETLKAKLTAENIGFKDEINILPAPELKARTQGLINLSVANLRSNPKHSAELATQATLGTPVKVLKKKEGWYYIQTPDHYLAWVDAGGIVLMDDEEMGLWKGDPKIIYKKTYGHSFSGPERKQPVSDLVAGDILETTKEIENFYGVRYPDGRNAFVAKQEAEPYNQWLEKLHPNADSLIATSMTLMGVPYLWGGTSTKGMDCSGFTKTVFFLNGTVIPRDASQQVHTGKAIDSVADFENLQKGDLLFFGSKATASTAEKVVHVGMWIGNDEFIHSSGRVRISSMDKDAENYDAFNRDRYLRTQRILNERDQGLISLLKTPLFKN